MSNLIDPLHLPPSDPPKSGPAPASRLKPAPARRPSGWLIVQHHVTPERLMIAMLILLVVFLWPRGHGPVPGPKPEPKPAPVAGKLYVTIVQDTAHKTQEAAQIEADPSLSEGLNALGAKFLNIDTHVAWLDSQHLRPQIDAIGTLPLLIIQAKDTKKIVVEKLPSSVTAILDDVRKFKGGER